MLVKGLLEAVHAVMQDSHEILVVDYSGEHPVAKTRPEEDFPEVETVPRRHRVTVGPGGQTLVEPLDTSILVEAEPFLEVALPYSAHMPVMDDGMYPPSSFAWYGRMVPDEKRVLFIVQRIIDDDKQWLTILDPETMEVYESYPVYQYEVGALQVRGATEYRFGYLEETPVVDLESQTRAEALAILNEPPPTWEQLWSLTKEYHVRGLTVGRTMRDTLTHLVPADWPEPVREEWMALLAWSLKQVPFSEDPVDLRPKLTDTLTLSELLPGHFIREALGIGQPEYVRLMHNPPSISPRPLHSPTLTPWMLAQASLASSRSISSPQVDIATRWAQKLNESGTTVTGLPVTRAMARRSRKNWIERCALMDMRMGLQCRPRVNALGLRSLIYIGSAHRWPHKHMAWKATLGLPKSSSLHVQEILIPSPQMEAVRRVRSGLRECVWYSRTVNHTTSVPIGQLMKTANRKRTLNHLKREFGHWKGKTPYTLTETDIRVIDGSSDKVELTDLELPWLKDFYGFTASEFHSSLRRLVSQGVVIVNYHFSEDSYPPRLVTLNGEEGSVLGLVRAVLRHTPMCSAYVLDDRGALFVMNLPPEQEDEVNTSLGTWAAENDVDMNLHSIGGFLNLRKNLFKRLWKGDHWDEDISAILSQVRVKGRN